MSEKSSCSFSWKRKIANSVNKGKTVEFERNAADETNINIDEGEIDWLHIVSKKKKV